MVGINYLLYLAVRNVKQYSHVPVCNRFGGPCSCAFIHPPCSLQICRVHSLIILEDDAYYWLQVGPDAPKVHKHTQLKAGFYALQRRQTCLTDSIIPNAMLFLPLHLLYVAGEMRTQSCNSASCVQYPNGACPEIQQPGLCLPPTLLSIDVDGRVLRIDTFAKLLGPG